MGKIKSKILDISSVGLTDMTGTGIVAVFWFYIASQLGPENYGELTYLISIATLVSGITLFGSNYTVWVMAAKKVDIQATIFLITGISSIIGSIIVFIFLVNIGVSLVILAYVLLSLVLSDFLGKKLYRTYSKYVITQKILMVTLGISFYYFIGEYWILVGIAFSYIHMIYPLITSAKKSKINFKLIKEKKQFIINNFAVSVGKTLYGSLDKLIIAPLLGFAILGNYSLGYQFFTIINLLPGTAIKYLIAQDASGVQNKKIKKLMVIASVGMAILGSIVAPIILSSIFPKFIEAEEIIRIISWAAIPMTIQATHYLPKLWAQEKNLLILYHTVVVVITQIIAIILFGTLYGAVGLAIAFLTTSIIGCSFIAVLDKIDQRKKE
jgi:O-antigen/teichoic acid export membrane protein